MQFCTVKCFYIGVNIHYKREYKTKRRITMGGNGVNFNAPKDTTAVRKFDTNTMLQRAGQGAVRGGIEGSIFGVKKDSIGAAGGKMDHFDYQSTVEYSGTAEYSGTLDYEGQIPYSGTVPITHTDYQNGVPLGKYEGNDGHWESDYTVTGDVSYSGNDNKIEGHTDKAD